MRLTHDNMVDALNDWIDDKDGQTVSWSDIKGVIETTFKPRQNFNWLRARHALQAFITEGFLTRTDDLRVEQYTVNLSNEDREHVS